MRIKRVGLVGLLIVLVAVFAFTLPKMFEGESETDGSLKMYRQLKHVIEVLDGYYATNEILVALDEGESIEHYEQLLHATMISEMRNGSIRMEIDDGKTFEDIIELHRTNDELLKKVFPHRMYRLMNQGDGSSETPHLDVLNMYSAWEHTSGEGITVAVIDTGIDYYHEGFSGIVSERSYNAMTKQVGLEHVMDYDGHGTSVAGVIKHRYEGLEHQGIAPNVELMVIKTGDYPAVYQEYIDEAIYYAMQENVDVINMSLGGPAFFFYDEFMAQSNALLDAAIEQGIIIVASAGNESTTSQVYPASHPNVISVGATTFDGDELAGYSNYGRYVDVVAPGQIDTLEIGGGTGLPQGTSFSAPAVAGVVALYLSLNPGATIDEVRGMLISTASDLNMPGRDLQFAYGQVNAEAFLTAEKGTMTFIDETHDVMQVKYSAIGYPIVDLWRPVQNHVRYGGWTYEPEGSTELDLYTDLLSQDTTFYKQWRDYNDETHHDMFLLETRDEYVAIRSYLGDERTINMPSHYQDLAIKVIASHAFSSLYNMHRVTFSETIEVVESHGFFASSISQIEFAAVGNLETIESRAFVMIHHFSEIILPDSVKTIEDEAFSEITDLSYVYLGKQVEMIGENPFAPLFASMQNMGNFDWIEVHPENPYFVSVDGVLYDKEMTTLILYPTQRMDRSFIVPDSVTTIRDSAVYFQEHLEALVLGKNVQYIPDEFSLFNLKAIEVHPENAHYSSYKGVLYDETMTVLLHYPIRASNYEIVLPASVQYFYRYAFTTFGVFPNESETHTLLYLGEDFLTRELDEEALLAIGFDPYYAVGIEEVGVAFNDFNIALRDVYMSEAMVNAVIDEFDDVWFNDRGYNLQAYDELLIKTETLKDSYHFDYEMNVDYDIHYQGEVIGQVLLKEIIELDQAFKNTVSDSITFNYLDQTETLTLPLFPSITFNTMGGAYLEELRYDETLATIDRLPQAEKSGYHFTGWYLDQAHQVPFDAETLSSRVTLYARYEPLTYTVNYHYDGQTTVRHYLFDDKIDYVVDLEGQVLVDWVDEDGVSYFLHHMPNQDLDLYPVFEALQDASYFADYRFVIEQGYAVITDYLGDDTDIHIPRYYQDETGDIYYVTRLKSGLFLQNEAVETVVYPDYVRDIGGRAFYRAINLREVHLPSQLEVIRPFTFNHADSLEGITIPRYVQSIGKSAFLDATDLATIEFEEGARITVIERLAFSYINNVEAIILPDSIDYIGMNAFAVMPNLKSITLPSYLRVITEGLLIDTAIESIELPVTLEELHMEALARTKLQTVVIPERVNTLSRFVFRYSSSIASLEIGASVTTMHTDAFADIEGLAYISVDEDNSRFIVVDDMLLSVDQQTLLMYPAANPSKHLIIPETIRHINAYAFSGSQYLESVTMTNQVQTLGEGVFRGAEKLRYVELSNAITFIPHEAFYNTKSLRKLTIPDGVVTIGRGAFQASDIESIIIPDTVNRIERFAFAETQNLTRIVFPHDVTMDYSVLYLSNAKTVVFKGDLDYQDYGIVSGSIQPFGQMYNLEAIYVHEDFEQSLINYMRYFESYELDKIQVFDQLELDESATHIGINDNINEAFINLMVNQTVIHQVPFMDLIASQFAQNPLLIEAGLNQFDIRHGETPIIIDITLEAPLIQVRYLDDHDVLLSEMYYIQGSIIEPPALTPYYTDQSTLHHFVGWEAHDEIATAHIIVRAIYDQYLFEELIELIGPREITIGSDEPYYEVDIAPGFRADWDWSYYYEIDTETLGEYEVIVSISERDSHIELFSVTYIVHVVDIVVELALIGPSEVTIELGSEWLDEGASCNYNDGTPCDVYESTDFNPNRVGTYTMTYYYIDSQGGAHEVHRTINVVDTTPPTFDGLESIVIDLNDETPNYLENVTAYDLVDGDVKEHIIVDDSKVDYTKPGDYEVIYSVSDQAGNTQTETIMFRIIDRTLPTVHLETNLDTIIQGQDYHDTGVIIEHHYETDVEVSSSVNTSVPGQYTITYTVTDIYDNVTVIKRVVTVIAESPVIDFLLSPAKTTLSIGETYQDTGCTVLVNDNEINCNVKSNNVDTSQAGIYAVVYSISHQGEEYTYKRYVFVKDSETPLTLYYDFKRREGVELA